LRRPPRIDRERTHREVGDNRGSGITRAAAATGEGGEQRGQRGRSKQGLIHEDDVYKY
jgi:hypothetical protein